MMINKYIVKYKESDEPNQWRYFQSFYKSKINNKDKIENSYKEEESKILNYEDGEIVINEINRIYNKCQYFHIKQIGLKMAYGKKVSRFEIMDI